MISDVNALVVGQTLYTVTTRNTIDVWEYGGILQTANATFIELRNDNKTVWLPCRFVFATVQEAENATKS